MTAARPTAVTGPLGLLVAVAALAVVGVRPAAPAAAEPESPGHRVVGPAVTSCPAFPRAADETGGRTEVGAVVPVRPGSAPAGRLRVRSATGDQASVLTVDRPGIWRSAVVRAGTTDLTAASTGGLAVGAATYTVQRRDGAGVAVQRCAAPARHWWFVGAGNSAWRESTLVLVNLDDADSVVDVELRGADGALETSGTDGLRIPAGDRVSLPLSGLVAGEHDVAIEVDAVQGRVVAAVADDWSGVEGNGSDWLPASPAPARTVLLPGLQDQAAGSRLIVANDADSATPVDVSVVDDSGTFVPTDAPRVLVPAGGVVSVRVPDISRGSGLLVEADVPVNAAVRVGTGTGTGSDPGYAVQGPALDGPAAVPVDLGRQTRMRLHLAASLPPGAGTETPPARTATVTAFDASGAELTSTDVEVAAGTAVVVDPSDRAQPAYLVVFPDRPPGGAGALLVTAELGYRGGGLAMLPLETGLVRVTVPVVTPQVVL